MTDAYPQVWESDIDVQVAHRIGGLKIDVAFRLTQPWTVLFGPSGAGKTTILRAIAGLLRPERGRIVCITAQEQRSDILLDTTSAVFLPAHRRRIRFAAQRPALFPHLTVMENLRYGVSSSAISDWNVLESFGLEHRAHSLPAQLSGGEAQRMNLARALAASDSRLLLLDEPFTGMDAARREQLLPLLRERLKMQRVPVLSVTHDVSEAFQLGAEVIQIADGRVLQQGPVEIVLAEERQRLLRLLSAQQQSPA